MTPVEAASWVVADALENDRNLREALEPLPVSRQIVHLASGPQLRRLVSALALGEDVAALTEKWPRVLAPALRRLEQLPQRFRFRLHLAQTLVYLTLVAILQAIVISIVTVKVFPVFERMGVDLEAPVDMLDWFSLTVGASLCLALPVGLWLVSGAVGWDRLPGWGRSLARAREASLAAALLESRPPDDVRLAWLGRARWVGEPSLAQVDLDALALESSAAAERAMWGFLTRVRVVGLGVLTLNALGLLASVYAFVARLPGGIS